MAKGFDELISKVNSCSVKTVSVAVAQDAPVLEAVKAAKDSGWTMVKNVDFADGAWLNAPSGLVTVDNRCKPAYDKLLSLGVKGNTGLHGLLTLLCLMRCICQYPVFYMLRSQFY